MSNLAERLPVKCGNCGASCTAMAQVCHYCRVEIRAVEKGVAPASAYRVVAMCVTANNCSFDNDLGLIVRYRS